MGTRPGERKLQILQTLAEMLQNPKGEKITTAALAARLEVSEAALYRHFASKAQMFEGLIEFIESSLFSVINTIQAEQQSGMKQVEMILALLLGFAQKNRGLTRVLIGDSLVNEDDRLQTRINQVLDRCEAALKQALRIAVTDSEMLLSDDIGSAANMLMCYVVGRWNQFAKSGFARDPMSQWASQWSMLCAACLSQPVASGT